MEDQNNDITNVQRDSNGNRGLAAPASVRKVWSSNELLAGQAEVLIVHGEETYRLRRTRSGKLIMHK